jgi:thiol-disulfide isomerase/thioredoxin
MLRSRFSLPLPAFAPFLLALALFGCGKKESRPGEFADVTLPLYKGTEYTLSGKDSAVTLLVFWATWCKPCLIEIPHLNEFHEKFKDEGFRVVSVNLDDPEGDKIGPIARQFDIRYPILIDDGTTEEKFGGLRALPTSLLIGRDGLVKLKFEGMYPAHIVEEQIRELL